MATRLWTGTWIVPPGRAAQSMPNLAALSVSRPDVLPQPMTASAIWVPGMARTTFLPARTISPL